MPETIYSKAADVIRKRGWTQGNYVDEHGHVCLVGAISYALEGHPNNEKLDHVAFMRSCEAEDAIKHHLQTSWGELCPLVADWNDDPARSKEDVLLLLKELDAKEPHDA